MTYKIITDEKELYRFIEWLPNLNKDECYYVTLFARKKYHPSAKNDKSQCKRVTATSKEWLIKKIRQFEIVEGAYTNKDGSSVHNDSLALYISVNPRSFPKAQVHLLRKLVDTVTGNGITMNPYSLAMSSIQKSKSRTVFVDFDFDDIEFTEDMFYGILNKESYSVLITRGGFHLLIDPLRVDPEYKRSWYKKISEMKYCDVCGDNLIPVAGCTQGGFTPRIYNT